MRQLEAESAFGLDTAGLGTYEYLIRPEEPD
jgi:hypothetical protein